jgi:hypothetical protein
LKKGDTILIWKGPDIELGFFDIEKVKEKRKVVK